MPKYVIGSAVMLLLLFICALFAPYLAPFDPHCLMLLVSSCHLVSSIY
nr:hypothetical protein [Streptococcus equi]